MSRRHWTISKAESLLLSMPSKKPRIQLYADECFPVPSATYLRSIGYSITHAFDHNYVQKKDRFHLSVSKKLQKVLITLDRDFMYYEQSALRNHPGVIVISAGSATPQNVNKICLKLLQAIGNDFIKDSLVKVTSDKIIKVKSGEVVYEQSF